MTKKMRVEYLLSEAGQKKSLLAGGDGKEVQVLEVDICPELLERATIDWEGRTVWRVDYIPIGAQIVDGDGFQDCQKPYIKRIFQKIYFDEPQTVESLLIFVRWMEEKVEAEVARLESLLVEEEQRKKEWVAAHGSDFLKRAMALGYSCQRQYVTERAAKELPGFQVDFEGRATWESRDCPSEFALDLIEHLIGLGYQAECVWLTWPPDEGAEEKWKRGDGCEAIVVHNYLNKYTLIKW